MYSFCTNHDILSHVDILGIGDHFTFPLCITINMDFLPRFDDVGNHINSDVCRWHLADNNDF